MTDRPDVPHPSVSVPAPMVPIKVKHARNIGIQKRAASAAMSQARQVARSKSKRSEGAARDLEVKIRR